MTASSPERRRPAAPESVSVEARGYLNAISEYDNSPWPADGDISGWEALIAARDAGVRAMCEDHLPPEALLSRARKEVGGVGTYELVPAAVRGQERPPLFLEIHGGGLHMAGGELSWMVTAPKIAGRIGITWAPDYRNPPAHPFPAALDDCLSVYRAALGQRDASEIVVSSVSGGGNLAAALLLRARDEGLPMPAGLLLLTPQLDLTESGDSFTTNAGIDLLASLRPAIRLYAPGADLASPYLSPLFGDVSNFPPTFLQTGTRDLFLSNTVRMHRKLLAAGVETELHVFEAMPHGGFGGATPEDRELREAEWRFEQACLGIRPDCP